MHSTQRKNGFLLCGPSRTSLGQGQTLKRDSVRLEMSGWQTDVKFNIWKVILGVGNGRESGENGTRWEQRTLAVIWDTCETPQGPLKSESCGLGILEVLAVRVTEGTALLLLYYGIHFSLNHQAFET